MLLRRLFLIILLAVVGCGQDDKSVATVPEKNFTNSVGMEMVGLSKGYWVSKYETTQKQFVKIMGYNPCNYLQGENCPAENMTKGEADIFCQKLTEIDRIKGVLPNGYAYKLPSFKEWKQYVADAGLEKSITKAGKYNFEGWYDATLIKICEVGCGEVNRLGIYDLRGNVMELSRDISSDKNSPYKIFGANFRTSRKEYLRVNNICYTKDRRYDTGFRCVLVKSKNVNINNSILHNSIILGDIKKVSNIVKEQPDLINVGNKFGETPLHLAILSEHIEIIKLLITSGADTSRKTEDGSLSIHYACSIGNTSIVKILLENGVDIPDKSYKGMSLALMAVKNWKIDLVKLFVNAGVKDNLYWDLGRKGQYGNDAMKGSALLVTLEYKRFDIAKELLKGEIDFSILNSEGINVLQMSARLGWLEGVETMLKKGADVNRKDKNGRTAIYYAKLYEHEEVVSVLEKYGAKD